MKILTQVGPRTPCIPDLCLPPKIQAGNGENTEFIPDLSPTYFLHGSHNFSKEKKDSDGCARAVPENASVRWNDEADGSDHPPPTLPTLKNRNRRKRMSDVA